MTLQHNKKDFSSSRFKKYMGWTMSSLPKFSGLGKSAPLKSRPYGAIEIWILLLFIIEISLTTTKNYQTINKVITPRGMSKWGAKRRPSVAAVIRVSLCSHTRFSKPSKCFSRQTLAGGNKCTRICNNWRCCSACSSVTVTAATTVRHLIFVNFVNHVKLRN